MYSDKQNCQSPEIAHQHIQDATAACMSTAGRQPEVSGKHRAQAEVSPHMYVTPTMSDSEAVEDSAWSAWYDAQGTLGESAFNWVTAYIPKLTWEGHEADNKLREKIIEVAGVAQLVMYAVAADCCWPSEPCTRREDDDLARTAFDIDNNCLHKAKTTAASPRASYRPVFDKSALSKLELLPVELLNRIFGFLDPLEIWRDLDLLTLSKTLYPAVCSPTQFH